MKEFSQLPIETVFKITTFLDAKSLFLFASTSELNKEIVHRQILERTKNKTIYEKESLKLLNYWVENPHILLSKPEDTQKLIKNILGQNYLILPSGESRTLTCACLVILCARNLTETKQYFFRLCLEVQFEQSFIVPLLMKIAFYLNPNPSLGLFENNFKEKGMNHREQDFQRFLMTCKPYNPNNFNQLISDLYKNNLYYEGLNIRIMLPFITKKDGLVLAKCLSDCYIKNSATKCGTLELIDLCLSKLNQDSVNLFIQLKLKSMEEIIFKSLRKYYELSPRMTMLCSIVHRLNPTQALACFKNLLVYFKNIMDGDDEQYTNFAFATDHKELCIYHYKNLLQQLTLKMDVTVLNDYIEVLDTTISNYLQDKERYDEKHWTVVVVSLRKSEENLHLENEAEFLLSKFVKLVIKLPGNFSPLLDSLCGKIVNILRNCREELVLKYMDILKDCAVKFSSSSFSRCFYKKLQHTLFMTLSAENQLKYATVKQSKYDIASDGFSFLVELEKFSQTPLFCLTESQANKWFQTCCRFYFKNPNNFHLLMRSLAQKITPELAENHLQRLFDRKLASWEVSDDYIFPLTDALANRCGQDAMPDLVDNFFQKFLIYRNPTYQSRCCNILKILFSRLPLDQVKKFHSQLLENFTYYSPVSVIIEKIAHTCSADEARQYITRMLTPLNDQKKIGDASLVQKFINMFEPDQITFLFEHHMNMLQNTLNDVSFRKHVINILDILIPRLSASQLIMLYEIDTKHLRVGFAPVFKYEDCSPECLEAFLAHQCNKKDFNKPILDLFQILTSTKLQNKRNMSEEDEPPMKKRRAN